MKLAENFTLEELTKSRTALRNDIDNIPNSEHIENLKALCGNILQPVRNHYGQVVTVNSGFRCEALEKILTHKSYIRWCEKRKLEVNEESWEKYFEGKSHPKGEAGDIEIIGIPNIELAYWIRDNLEFDQLILEFYNPADPQGGWVHVSYNMIHNRKQVLTISKGGVVYGLPERHVI